MRPSSSARKRQTRLSFTPASFSPAPERSPGSDKVARIRYSNSLNAKPFKPKAPQFGKKMNETPKKTEKKPLSSTSSSEEEPIRTPLTSRRKLGKRNFSQMDPDSGSDDDLFITSSPTKRRRFDAVIPSPVSGPTASKEVADEESSDSDEIVRSSPLRRRKQNFGHPMVDGESGHDEDDSGEGVGKRRNGRIKRDKLDLEEDLEDLRNSDVVEDRTRGGQTMSASKIKRQQQLEALKRSRAEGKATPSSSRKLDPVEEEEEEEEKSESEGSDTSSSASSSSSDEPIQGRDSDVESEASEDLDQYEADFVLEDDDGTLGAPADLVEMPFEFTRHRYKRLKDHFKDVVEWMVHNKLNPAFRRDDPIYKAAFSKVEDEVNGITGSQLLSSVWNVDFRRSLEARPEINVTTFPITEGHPCDACNRSKHPASFDVMFTGRPYLLETLEPISDEEGDSDEERKRKKKKKKKRRKYTTLNRQGNEVPDENVHYYLGRHCKAKAEMAHTLIHWRYELNDWILDYLRQKGVFSDSEVLKRENWSQNKRSKHANSVVDAMEEAKEIDRLWKDFNLNLKTARSMPVSRW